MSYRVVRPKWWQLYLTFPLLMGLFLLDSRLRLSTGGHEALQLGSLLLEFILVHLWLRGNAGALSYMDDDTYHRTVTIIEMFPSRPPEDVRPGVQTLRLSDSEIRGVLSDTFEMDQTDVDFHPANRVPQTLDKEQE